MQYGIKITVIEKEYKIYKRALKEGRYQLFLGEVKLTPNMDISPLVSQDGKLAFGLLKKSDGKVKSEDFDIKELEEEIKKLILDDDVTKKSGIYPYVLTRNEKYLSIRTFSDNEKLQAYTKQNGICKICGKHFELEEMEADHITPWSQGGKTNLGNCQMLCRNCNRRKSDK